MPSFENSDPADILNPKGPGGIRLRSAELHALVALGMRAGHGGVTNAGRRTNLQAVVCVADTAIDVILLLCVCFVDSCQAPRVSLLCLGDLLVMTVSMGRGP